MTYCLYFYLLLGLEPIAAGTVDAVAVVAAARVLAHLAGPGARARRFACIALINVWNKADVSHHRPANLYPLVIG